ncbi:hypothetical protein Hanom_Chr10g00929781 [Helianthus anomalus]
MTTGEHDPFLKQITPAAFAIRAPGRPKAPLENPGGAESTTGTRGSGGPLVTPEVQELDENEDSDPEIRALDRNLNAQTSSATIYLVKGKVTASSIFADVQNLTPRKRKGTKISSSLGSDCFLGDDEDQVSSIPPSWFKPEDKLQRTPDTEKQVAQLTHDLAAQKKKIKALTAQCQSAQVTAASAGEEKDKSVAELEKFSSTMKKNDKAHKELLDKMEDSLSQARVAYERMIKGEANLKAKIEAMQKKHEEEISDSKLKIANLSGKVQELAVVKA